MQFLAERWSDWDSEGRPLIAEAYKIYLTAAVRMLQMTSDMTFDDIKEAVDRQTLDVVWPDWAREQKERVSRTLQGAVMAEGPGALSTEEIAAFADFVEKERQDAIFLRLESFERHAFDDLDARLTGMSSDVQGMAVAVEHVIRAMGATKGDLYEMFQELWTDREVAKLLKRNSELARKEKGMVPSDWEKDWPARKSKIEQIRCSGPAEAVAADLVMARCLRGGVHHELLEQDQFEIEKLFVALLRAAAMSHAHVQRSQAAAVGHSTTASRRRR
jgi:hypothetical protein